ncbi:MAG: glutathione S-transferase family protein [Xanthobacteraceae bacterium]|nr:MAG: glutathione S-transferase family protein [Xanthobacteraceae bacterium]
MFDLAGADPARRFSPYCWRIKMALAHKGLEVETIPWRFTDKDVIGFSHQGRVPVLLDGERVVWDSWTIANYLEDTYPERPSLFGGAGGRAAIRFINGWGDAGLHRAMFRLVLIDILHHVHEKDRAYFRESREKQVGMTLEEASADRDARVHVFRASLDPIRIMLRTQPFYGGAAPNYGDYIAFGAFQWARCVSPFRLLEENDPVHAWRERLLDLHDGLARRALGYPV